MAKKEYKQLLKEAISEFDTSKTVEVKGPMLDPILKWDGGGEVPTNKDAASILERYYFSEDKDKFVEEMDFNDDDGPDTLIEVMKGQKADLVLSDMAPNTIGHKNTDHLRIMHLVELAYYFAKEVLKPDGAFLAKTRQGGTSNDLLAMMKRDFKTVKHIKPPSSRKDSSETFVIAQGFRGVDKNN